MFYQVLNIIFLVINYTVTAVILGVVGLMIIYLILYLADVNPFSKPARWTYKLTDPLLRPTRMRMRMFGIDPKYAPLIVILVTILLGYFALQIASSTLSPLAGLVGAIQAKHPVTAVGYVLYGALSIYYVVLFMRIIFSWVWSPYENRLMRFLVRVTDPLLEPLRRMIPPFGSVDLSFFLAPLLAFFLIGLLQTAVAATLLRGAAPGLFM